MIEIGSHRAIRHAYENVLNACARLASFAMAGPLTTDDPITERQEILAADDLVTFGIHARRLIENTVSKKRFRQVTIGPGSKQQEVGIPITGIVDIIDTLIHHREVKVVRHLFALELERRTVSVPEFIQSHGHLMRKGGGDKYFSPIVFVTSDRHKNISFDIAELIETFEHQILKPIITICDEHKLYLEDVDLLGP
jgi:hypothetical protein